MAERVDVAVVGARCAGASLAVHLARAGLRVCVLDRAEFPSDTLSTHGIQPSGVRALDRLGVRAELETLTAPITQARIALGAARASVDDITALAGAPMLNVRRITLDRILVSAAATAGADVRTGVAVTGLLRRDGQVAGVRTSEGDLAASVVVGADGARSTVADLVGAREYAVTEPGRTFAWAYLEDVPASSDGTPATVWLGKPGRHAFLASVTDGDMFLAAVTLDHEDKPKLLADREGYFRAALVEWPELAEVVQPGRVCGPVRVMSNWRGFFRRSAGPGWALVGDAGHFKDPTPGQGIADAFRQSERLAAAIVSGLSGRLPLPESLNGYWRWRDEDAWPMYWFANDLGAPGPTTPLRAHVQQLIAGSPGRTEQLLRVLDHEISPSAVTSPGLLLRALRRALRTTRGQRASLLAEAGGLVREDLRRRLAKPRQATESDLDVAVG
ncbi:MAG: FAD-dependent monooxygenase [Frankiales bacterium]|nr:FAD-dependent monooxygenase [Frankiales bacterium]